jgi:hypothetical protein
MDKDLFIVDRSKGTLFIVQRSSFKVHRLPL